MIHHPPVADWDNSGADSIHCLPISLLSCLSTDRSTAWIVKPHTIKTGWMTVENTCEFNISIP